MYHKITIISPEGISAMPGRQSHDSQDMANEHEPLTAPTDYDSFMQTDLRAGTITAAELHPKADRLLVLQVDLGFEQRTIVAGIAEAYEPEDLTGKRVIAVANLEPRKLRGIVSQGMLLAGDDAEGKPRLIEPDANTTNGTRVR